jgi:hypothetical protein
VRDAFRAYGPTIRLCQNQFYVTTEHCERRFDPRKLGRMVRIENATGFLLVKLPARLP